MAQRLLSGLVALLLAACSHVAVIEVDDAREGHPEREAAELMSEACEILGIDCLIAGPGDDAPILMVITDGCDRQILPSGGRICGRAVNQSTCNRGAWAYHEPEVIAHELGHVLGLEHSDDPDNLMFPHVSGTELTDAQRRKMDRNLARLSACP